MYYRPYGFGSWRSRYYRSSNTPPVDILETETEYIINLYAPALRRENVVITTQNDILSVGYKADTEAATRYVHKEYRPEEISRSFDLKGKVNIEGITAIYMDGVLKLRLPKSEAARRPGEQISVQ